MKMPRDTFYLQVVEASLPPLTSEVDAKGVS